MFYIYVIKIKTNIDKTEHLFFDNYVYKIK